jgi:hypothetical protein
MRPPSGGEFISSLVGPDEAHLLFEDPSFSGL